jgi:hypothetical protein
MLKMDSLNSRKIYSKPACRDEDGGNLEREAQTGSLLP